MLHELSQLVLIIIWNVYCGLNKQYLQQCLCLNTWFPTERIIFRGKGNFRGSILQGRPDLIPISLLIPFLGGRGKMDSPSCSNQCGVCFPAMKNSNRWNSTQTDHCFLEMISVSHLFKAMTSRSTPDDMNLYIWQSETFPCKQIQYLILSYISL